MTVEGIYIIWAVNIARFLGWNWPHKAIFDRKTLLCVLECQFSWGSYHPFEPET